SSGWAAGMRSGSRSLAHSISYTNDPVGRPTRTQLADGRLLGAAYDGNGNTTDVTLPSPESHAFSFTPVDLLSAIFPTESPWARRSRRWSSSRRARGRPRRAPPR